MGPNENTIPCVSTESFKVFPERTLTFVCQDSISIIKSTFKDQPQFFGFIYPGLAEIECEITEAGDIITHRGATAHSKLKCTMGLANFKEVTMDKISPPTVLMTEKAKLDGPMMTEAMKFIGCLPALKQAYQKTRKEIGRKYGLANLVP